MKRSILFSVLLLAGAWALSRPVPECPDRGDQDANLSCEIAVKAALGALPPDHAVTRIQFMYGSMIPLLPALLVSGEQATIGVVKFTYEDGSREYVDVAEWQGEVTAAAPVPY